MMNSRLAWLFPLLISGNAWAEEARVFALDIKGTTLTQLMNLKITSLSRKQEDINKAAAAVYVITRDEIRRMGVTDIPEALRYVPGLEVARLSASSWAISIRGFNSRTANKLLVMIDGRSIYSPLFSGVLWEEKDVLLEDVERIEIIRGPGGSLWGANAVNGVINIITCSADKTRGTYVAAGVGKEQRNLVEGRVGWQLDERTDARVYMKYRANDESPSSDPEVRSDDRQIGQIGFRADRRLQKYGVITVQGDWYDIDIGDSYDSLPSELAGQDDHGGNLLTNWRYATDGKQEHELLLYYDTTLFYSPTFIDKRHVSNIDYRWLARGERHELALGAGFRQISDNTSGTARLSLVPASRDDDLYSAFVQDDIAFFNRALHLIIGTKYENNDYTGDEWQPSIRASFQHQDSVWWIAWSRTVRTPTRLEHDLLSNFVVAGQPFQFYADQRLQHETADIYEIGWRYKQARDWQTDISVYVGEYDKLLSVESTDLANKNSARIAGVEASLDWQWRPNWLLRFNYSHSELDVQTDSDSLDARSEAAMEGSVPADMAQLISLWDINDKWQLNTYLRFYDALPAQETHSYTVLDFSLVWRVHVNGRLQLAGRHLGNNRHREWLSPQSEVEQDIVLSTQWNFN
jgi:iron complex outermembrane receptor protein